MKEKTFAKLYFLLILYTIGIVFITSLCWWFVLDEKLKETKTTPTEIEYIYKDKEIDKNALVNAIIYVESKGNNNAIGDSGASVGCLQIQPIYIDEVNRLLGYDKYSYSDRNNRSKSISIFNDMQDLKNPDYDIHLAIKLHNPKAGYKYHKDIEDKYNELTKK